jgi:hypothetical protein
MSGETPIIGTTGTNAIDPATGSGPTSNIRARASSDGLRADPDPGTKIGKKIGLRQLTCNALSEATGSESAEEIANKLAEVKLR